MGIFHDFFARNYLSISKITWKMAFSLKLLIKDFFFHTVHNLITFSIVFTNKNRGGGHIEPPPPIQTKVWKQPIKRKVKYYMPKKSWSILYWKFQYSFTEKSSFLIFSFLRWKIEKKLQSYASDIVHCPHCLF